MFSIPFIDIKKNRSDFFISSVADGYESFILSNLSQKLAPHSPLVFVVSDSRKLGLLKQNLSFVDPTLAVLTLPGWDCLPYDRVSPSYKIVSKRLKILTDMMSLKKKPCRSLILMSVSALVQKIPSRQTLSTQSFSIKLGDSIKLESLIALLEEFCFERVVTVHAPGEYAVRGGILDLFPSTEEQGVRLDFFGDTLESLRSFDVLSQRTIEKKTDLLFFSMRELTLTKKNISHFRQKYVESFGSPSPMDSLYSCVSEGKKFIGMEHWLPFFHDELETVFDYLDKTLFVFDHLFHAAVGERYALILDHYKKRKEHVDDPLMHNKMGIYHPVAPENLYLSYEKIMQNLQDFSSVTLSPFDVPAHQDTKIFHADSKKGRNFFVERTDPNMNVFEKAVEYIKKKRVEKKIVMVCGWTQGSVHRLSNLLQDYHVETIKYLDSFLDVKQMQPQEIGLAALSLESGFETDQYVVMCEQDIFGDRLISSEKRKKKNARSAITEAISLFVGDIVVHVEHGIGRFLGLRTIKIDMAMHDCLEILYAEEHKLLLPVENIELLSRYGSDSSSVVLDRLGGNSWQRKKDALKAQLLEIAGSLIQIAAERKMISGPTIIENQDAYERFKADFGHEETQDQQNAIDSVLEDFSLGKPMDRLICGDVGFGKTEIALRAAFLTVMSGYQVAVIVPTTFLSRQHFKLFKDRFAPFPVHVHQLSRLVTPTQARVTKKQLEEGSVDIVIGSHALLSSSIVFKNLGLMIIDEEQHFGVKQKEYLKNLKRNIHVLTLSATPIPRTLQFALTGVSEISLIQTPPVDRIPVRSSVSPFDIVLIRETLLREKYRGGQSFYVVPRISDIDQVLRFLTEHVPEVKVSVAHGKMNPKVIEDVMEAFYHRAYDVLLSTSIVECGLDIPTANTIIVHRCDVFGLSQLYQLRGRVGRSKDRGYALFLLPEKIKVTDSATQRLKILQSLDNLGAGFQLATYDMDLRGAGNFLGEQQSGHVKTVGFELYQKMLEEAIGEMKGSGHDLASKSWSPQITSNVTVMIPDHYVKDLSLRLGLYRRIGELESQSEIHAFSAELIDRFGPFPAEVDSLLKIVFIKIFCRKANIAKLDIGKKGAVISFREGCFSKPALLVSYIAERTPKIKIRPDQSLLFLDDWPSIEKQLAGAMHIVKDLVEMAEI